jgi:hypothetical protein
MKIKAIICSLYLINSISITAQTFYGIGLSTNVNKLFNISEQELTPYGFSGAKITQAY